MSDFLKVPTFKEWVLNIGPDDFFKKCKCSGIVDNKFVVFHLVQFGDEEIVSFKTLSNLIKNRLNANPLYESILLHHWLEYLLKYFYKIDNVKILEGYNSFNHVRVGHSDYPDELKKLFDRLNNKKMDLLESLKTLGISYKFD